MELKIAVLIPAYQPDEKLIKLTESLILSGLTVLIVDDGSDKGCAGIFERTAETGAVLLTHDHNRGKGAALKTGIEYLCKNGFDAAVTADADGQHTPEDILKIIAALRLEPDRLILGVRDVEKMPPRSKFGNSITRRMFDMLYGIKVSDTQTGLRGIPICDNSDALLKLGGERYEYEMNMLICSRKIFSGITEVGIDTVYIDDNSSSHFRPVRDGMKIYAVLFRNMPSFLLASLASFGVDYLLFALFVSLTGDMAVLSTVMARVLSGGFNFTVNKLAVFRDSKSYTFMRYFVLAVAILVVNCSLMFLAKNILNIPPLLAKIIIETVLYIASFVIQSRFASKGKSIS